jgi:hypothetical protein
MGIDREWQNAKEWNTGKEEMLREGERRFD